ncbi:hypothetical protein [Psychrobacter sp. AH5]
MMEDVEWEWLGLVVWVVVVGYLCGLFDVLKFLGVVVLFVER